MVVALLTTGSMAHHGYGEYDRNASVTLEGTVTRVLWTNPHVVLTLKTTSGIEYAVEWAAVTQLASRGIATAPVKEGDSLLVTGSVNRNPEKRILTLLQEIRRPADGWVWMSLARARQNAANQ
jgi:hypothetical protein